MKIYFSSKNEAVIMVAFEEGMPLKRLKLILEEVSLMGYPIIFSGGKILTIKWLGFD